MIMELLVINVILDIQFITMNVKMEFKIAMHYPIQILKNVKFVVLVIL